MTLWLLYNVHNDKSIDCRAIIVSLNPRPICGKTHHRILGPTNFMELHTLESKIDVGVRIKVAPKVSMIFIPFLDTSRYSGHF
jgi:hypothetical protein